MLCVFVFVVRVRAADGRRPRLIGVYCGPLFHFGGNSSPPVRLSCWIKVGAVSLLSTHTVLPPWPEAHTESRGESADCNPVDAPELKAVCRKSLSIRCARRRCFFRGASIQAARGHARVASSDTSHVCCFRGMSPWPAGNNLAAQQAGSIRTRFAVPQVRTGPPAPRWGTP